jgi:hypothetical protein
LSDFEKRAEQLFPHVLEYAPDDTVQHKKEISDSVQHLCNQLFIDQCLTVLLPNIQTEIVEHVKNEIAYEIQAIPIDDLGVFSFTDLSIRYENTADAQFHDLITQIHQEIVLSARCNQLVESLRMKISDHVKSIESVKKQKYSEHIKAENERQRQKLEQQFQENLKKMSEEEAKKKGRQLEQEKVEAIRRQQESENNLGRRDSMAVHHRMKLYFHPTSQSIALIHRSQTSLPHPKPTPLFLFSSHFFFCFFPQSSRATSSNKKTRKKKKTAPIV